MSRPDRTTEQRAGRPMPRMTFGAPARRSIRLGVQPRLRWRLLSSPMRAPLVLVLGFAALIAAGTALLLLPVSARAERADPVTALFTATSAVCVTGLVVVDTGTYWSPFGQAVIVALMQLGGLGFVVGATGLLLLRGGRMSLRQRMIGQEIGSTLRLGGQAGLLRRAVLLALVGETIGALLLWARFAPDFGPGHGLWLAVFHSVAAFANAGFDLFGEFRSLAGFRTDPFVLLTITGLTIAGGLSLVVVEDLRQRRRWHRLSLDTRVVLVGTAVLLAAGTVVIYLAERRNAASLGDLAPGHQWLNAFFHSAAARTAGFATWDFARADDRSLFFMLGLMFVGAAPGSMAGGIKLTTTAVILAAVWSTLRGRSETMLLERRLPPRLVGQALTVAFLGLALIANVALVISLIEGDRLQASFLQLVFEVTSAFGTVGFSAGVTLQLSAVSKLLLVLTMFVGRLGPITVALQLTAWRREAAYRPPSEAVRIG